MNAADKRIVELLEPGDLVITADIPLAAEVVAAGAEALDPRGELYTDANVGERVALVTCWMNCAVAAWSREDQPTLAPRIDRRLQINSIVG